RFGRRVCPQSCLTDWLILLATDFTISARHTALIGPLRGPSRASVVAARKPMRQRGKDAVTSPGTSAVGHLPVSRQSNRHCSARLKTTYCNSKSIFVFAL